MRDLDAARRAHCRLARETFDFSSMDKLQCMECPQAGVGGPAKASGISAAEDMEGGGINKGRKEG